MRTPGRSYSASDRVVVWFSCGATSAVAAWLAAKEWGKKNLRIVYCDTGSEHPSNAKFLRDVEAWVGHPIETIKNPKYEDIWDVFTKRRYIAGVNGAPCTLELKKKMRQQFEEFDDIQVFGFDHDETARAANFIANNPEVKLWAPLIEQQITKGQCKYILEQTGIELPFMYQPQKSGSPYSHNNCIGCPKGQQGYWNKIRIDFPEVFHRMASLEREIGAAVNKRYEGKTRIPVYLDELHPDAGRFEDEPPITCDMLCSMETDDLIKAVEGKRA